MLHADGVRFVLTRGCGWSAREMLVTESKSSGKRQYEERSELCDHGPSGSTERSASAVTKLSGSFERRSQPMRTETNST